MANGGAVGIPQTSLGLGGRFGVTPPNRQAPMVGGSASPSDAGVENPWWASGPLWVLVFLVVGYILVFQTLRRG